MAPPARNAVGPDPLGRRLQRRRGGRGGGRAGAVRAGQRRRRLGPDPGQRLRPVRHQADPRPGQQRPARLGDVTGLARNGPLARTRPGRGGDARRDGGADAGRPALGAAAARRRDLPGVRRRATRAAADRPVRRRRPSRAPRCDPDCLAAYEAATEALTGLGHGSRTSTAAVPARGDRRVRDRLGRVGGLRAGRPGPGGRAAAADPLAAGPRRGDRPPPSSSARCRSCRCSPGSGSPARPATTWC